ncbi:MAG: hypothetical protein LRZ88_08835 [Candidatus Cloacimonetes bacterium]|nr:hypothetical protein [Candidatus Cloacimonadota bacterium]
MPDIKSELLQAFSKVKYNNGVTVEAVIGKQSKPESNRKDDWKSRRSTKKSDAHVDYDTTYHGRNIWTAEEGQAKKKSYGKKAKDSAAPRAYGRKTNEGSTAKAYGNKAKDDAATKGQSNKAKNTFSKYTVGRKKDS